MSASPRDQSDPRMVLTSSQPLLTRNSVIEKSKLLFQQPWLGGPDKPRYRDAYEQRPISRWTWIIRRAANVWHATSRDLDPAWRLDLMPRHDLVRPEQITDSPEPATTTVPRGSMSLTSHVMVAERKTLILRCWLYPWPPRRTSTESPKKTNNFLMRSKSEQHDKKSISRLHVTQKMIPKYDPMPMKQNAPGKIQKNLAAQKSRVQQKITIRNGGPRPPEPPTQSAWVSPGGLFACGRSPATNLPLHPMLSVAITIRVCCDFSV